MSKQKNRSVGKKDGTTLKNILRSLKPYRIRICLSVLLSAANVALTLYAPVLVGEAVDVVAAAGGVDFGKISVILVKLGAAAVAAAAFQWIVNAVNNTIVYRVVRDVRQQAFDKLSSMPLSYLDTHPTGELVSRIITDADTFGDGLLMGFSRLFAGAATIAGTLVFMLALSPAISAAVVLVTPLSLLTARFIATRTYSMFREQSQTRAEQTAFIDEMIGGHFTVKAFSMEEKNSERFSEINKRLEKCSLRAIFFSSLTNPTTRFVNSVVYALVALVGGLICISSYAEASAAGTAAAFTVGNLTAFLAYANQYTKPFNEISGVVTELQNAFACAARVFELAAAEPEIPDAPDAESMGKAEGRVEMRDVTFSYTPDRSLIEGMNLSVAPGQRVAIVGPTGCGKTTLINLLMRFYDVTGGSISVDGRDIRKITRESLRKNYGMVLQDTWLKNATVRENIAMGRPDADIEEIRAAAKAAHADSFIRRLPDGYDTVLGEDGGSLSQGQKQLLCISRIMLALPPMLILDEATSSIDTRTEMKIQEAFAKLMKGRTSFIVAHRLSTVREADVILVMKDGNIIEQGRHGELLAKNGFYAHLYNSQFEGADTDGS